MKVCLINPTILSDGNCDSNKMFMHLGLGYMASVLVENGYEVDIIECFLHRISIKETVEKVVRGNYDVVGVSIYYFNYANSMRIIRMIKSKKSSIFVFTGGFFSSINYEELLKVLKGIDCCIIGEGEYTCLELIQLLDKGLEWRNILGIAYCADKKIIKNHIRPVISDLDKLPYPKRVFIDKSENASMIVSRGCYQNCAICGLNSFLKIQDADYVRMRTVRNVVDEIDLLVNKHGIKTIYFQDNNLITNKQWIEEFCEEVAIRNIKFKFQMFARCNNIYGKAHVLGKLKELGLQSVFVESGSFVQRQIDFYKKNTSHDVVMKGFTTLNEHNIKYTLGLILLDPYTTIDEIISNLDSLEEIKFYENSMYNQVPISMISPLYPIHGTPFSQYMEEKQMFNRNSELKYDFLHRDVEKFYSISKDWNHIIEPINKNLLLLIEGNEVSNKQDLIEKKAILLKTDLQFLYKLARIIKNNNILNDNFTMLIERWRSILWKRLKLEKIF